jgi:catechol 2,3-dioxygenase-like lactoylglutathione lyase family enzyme
MLRIGAIVLNVSDLAGAREFWSQALGYRRGANPDFLAPPEGDGPRVHLDQTDRTHLDLWTDSEEEQRAEVTRLEALGATRVEWQYPDDADFVVLADPDGTLFCVINTAG